MKKKRMIILLLQFILVLASVGGVIYYMNSQTETVDVYVYTKDFIESNQMVTEADIQKVTVPKIATTEDFATDKNEIVGRYAQAGVKAGQYIYLDQLTESAEQDVFETMDLTEYRKISLPIDMVQGLSGSIRRGDYIDLVYSGKAQKTGSDLYSTNEFTYSNTFLQNVLVYSVNTADGYLFEGYSDIKEGTAVDENGEPVKKSQMGIITLAVTLPQAEQIYARTKVGQISFVGRFKDSKDVETLGYVIGDYSQVFSGEAKIEDNDGVTPGAEAPQTNQN